LYTYPLCDAKVQWRSKAGWTFLVFIADSVAGACNESSWKWILLRNSLQMTVYRNIAYFTSRICYKPRTIDVDCLFYALSCVLHCCVCSERNWIM